MADRRKRLATADRRKSKRKGQWIHIIFTIFMNMKLHFNHIPILNVSIIVIVSKMSNCHLETLQILILNTTRIFQAFVRQNILTMGRD